MEIIFHSHANETRFHEKGCAPSLILKVRVFGTRKWPIQVPKKFANIRRIKQDGISAIKFEAARIHFLSNVVVTITVVVA